MASKNKLKAQIAGLEAARDMALRDAEYLRKREARRAESERAERQRKLKEAERRERVERVEHIEAGRLPLKGATQWAIVHEEGSKPGIEVFVPLSEPELRAAQNYLGRRGETEAAVRPIVDEINAMTERMRQAYGYGIVAPRRTAKAPCFTLPYI